MKKTWICRLAPENRMICVVADESQIEKVEQVASEYFGDGVTIIDAGNADAFSLTLWPIQWGMFEKKFFVEDN